MSDGREGLRQREHKRPYPEPDLKLARQFAIFAIELAAKLLRLLKPVHRLRGGGLRRI